MNEQLSKGEVPEPGLPSPEPPRSRGEIIMNVNFNRGKNPDVDQLKIMCAHLWDMMDAYTRHKLSSGETPSQEQAAEINRLSAIAKEHLETAQMYIVKAITR